MQYLCTHEILKRTNQITDLKEKIQNQKQKM